jgi:hypothetical protein
MGEAKAKRTHTQRLIAEQVYCTYCGGDTPGTTVDHMPPRSVFTNKDRPKGMEFLACQGCNDGSRLDELAVSVLSRAYADDRSEAERQYLQRLTSSLATNLPELLLEMRPTPRQKRSFSRTYEGVEGGALNASGPLLTRVMHRFGAKLGLAMHRHVTGRVVPVSGIASVIWYTNNCAMTGRFPANVHEILGPPETLRQGEKHVADQFQVASAVPSDSTLMSVHMATFRRSFAVLTFVAEHDELLGPSREGTAFRPGFLKEQRPARPVVLRLPTLRYTQKSW